MCFSGLKEKRNSSYKGWSPRWKWRVCGGSIHPCLKVKFLSFCTTTGLRRLLSWGCTEWCWVYPRSRVWNKSAWWMGSSSAVFSATGISLHAEGPALDTTSCTECQQLATGFMSWAPAFKFSFVEACSLSQGVAFISSGSSLQSQEIFIYFFSKSPPCAGS